MDLFEVILAFFEGMALIVSPCILPVLPLVLCASLEGGRRRPYGIIFGFIFAFSAFALLSAELVALLGINLDLIKYVSLFLLAMLAIVLISTTLSTKLSMLTQGLAELGSRVASQQKEGFLSGILIGALIGLVWTPCAGPIMAAALVEVIRQQSNLGSALIILAFSTGAALPMLIIVLVGKEITTHMKFFLKHAQIVRKTLGVLILVSVGFIASGVDLTPQFQQAKVQLHANAQGLIDGLSEPYAAPEFGTTDVWINSNPLTMHSLRGKVVLVDFWTYSCINCLRTLPYITAWDQKYRQAGLVIVGVHAPEFEFEKNLNNVRSAVEKYHIHYPVALDNSLSTWSNFHNSYWPAHYLINQAGQVVYTHFGEGDYAITEHNIRWLLKLHKVALSSDNQPYYSALQTPETYLGYLRMNRFDSDKAIDENKMTQYHFPQYIPTHHWALQGNWTVMPEKIVSGTGVSALRLHFNAKKVFLVMGSATGQPLTTTIALNGKPIGNQAGKDVLNNHLIVKQHALYGLVNQSQIANGLLEIQSSTPGIEAYAFTFGNDD